MGSSTLPRLAATDDRETQAHERERRRLRNVLARTWLAVVTPLNGRRRHIASKEGRPAVVEAGVVRFVEAGAPSVVVTVEGAVDPTLRLPNDLALGHALRIGRVIRRLKCELV